MKADPKAPLRAHLTTLQLPYMREHFEPLAQHAAAQSHSHLDYLACLVEGEAHRRETRSIERRVKGARFPMLSAWLRGRLLWARLLVKSRALGAMSLSRSRCFSPR